MVTALFLVYERPVRHGNIRVRFSGKALRYEVKDFGSRHAVVCFTDIPEDVTFEVETY